MSHEVALVGPALGLSAPDTVAVLETAALAPSVHNAQPWAFRTAPDVVELYADATRRMPVADPDDQELRLGCGAALFNLRLALLVRGVRPDVALFPDPARRHLVAQVRRAGTARATPELERLLDAVPRRHTNRRPFTDAAVTGAERYALCRAAADEGALLHVVPPALRAEVGRLSVAAHRRQLADPAFRDELLHWTGAGADRTDGVPARAAGPAPAPHDRWVVRDFTGGTARERAPGRDVEEEPLLAAADPARDRPRRGGPRGRGDAAGAAHRDHGGPGGVVPLAAGGGPRGARRAAHARPGGAPARGRAPDRPRLADDAHPAPTARRPDPSLARDFLPATCPAHTDGCAMYGVADPLTAASTSTSGGVR